MARTRKRAHPNQRKGTAKDDREKRMLEIDELVYDGWSRAHIVGVVAKKFKVTRRQTHLDYNDAERRRAPEDAAERELVQERYRRKWERRVWRCETKGDETAANYALDRETRVVGGYAAKKIEISGSVGVAMSMDAVISVLDTAGLAALELVLGQVEAAKASGKLAGNQNALPSGVDEPVEVVTPLKVRKKK